MKHSPEYQDWIVDESWIEIWDSLKFEESEYDWFAWKVNKEFLIGGLMLVLPKNGKQSFSVSSGYCADSVLGVSSLYSISFECDNHLLEISKIISKHTELSAVEAYKISKQRGRTDFFFITAPLEMLSEIKSKGGSVALYRPNDRGGYF